MQKMKQPYSRFLTSHVDNEFLQPRVARSLAPNHQLLEKEARSMCARSAPVSRVAKTVVWFSAPAILCSVFSLLFLSLPLAAQTAASAAHSPGWVVISVDDYRTLRHKAFPAERDPELPPVDATLTRVDYDLRINGDLAAGRASLTVDVLKDGWVRVPIPAGLLVREARLDGKLVSLVPSATGKGNGQLSALLSHTGRGVLQLDIALPVASSAGQETITLPSAPSGITRAVVLLPRQGVDIQLNGGFLADQSESAQDSKWTAYGRGNEPLTFTWRRKTEDHHVTLPLRMRGSLTQLIGLGEDSTTISAEVNVEITQGAAPEVRVDVPAGITINQVQGAAVADWDMKAGDLAITFLEPVEQSTRFVITGELHTPRDGPMDIPLLRLKDLERETGGVAIEVLGAGEIKEFKPEGLESADATDLGEIVASHQSPSLAAYRFRSGDAKTVRSLKVNVARYTPQAVLMANIEEARYEVLLTNDGKTLVQARYAVRNNQRNFLKINLPPGATLWSASLSGKPVRPGQATDGSILLPLEKSRAGDDSPEFAVEIIYLSRGTPWTDKGQMKLSLPALDLPISRTGLVAHYPPLFRVTPQPGAFTVETYVDPFSTALNPQPVFTAALSASPAPAPPASSVDGKDLAFGGRNYDALTQLAPGVATLVDEYRAKSDSGKVRGILPIRVSFPTFGPSVYLVSELTSENQAAYADLNFQRDKKAGGK
jgi:hypothetical protein